jgi:hypothetical protein
MVLLGTRATLRCLALIASAMLVVLTMFDSCSALRLDRSAEKRMEPNRSS